MDREKPPTPEELNKLHEEALELNKKAGEKIDNGEAKTFQETISKEVKDEKSGDVEKMNEQQEPPKKPWQMTLDEFIASANVQEMPGWRGFMINGEFYMGDEKEKVLRSAHHVTVMQGFSSQEATLPREVTQPYPELDARNVLQRWRNIINIEKNGVLTENELEMLQKDIEWAYHIERTMPIYNEGLKSDQYEITWRRERLQNFYRKASTKS